MLLYESDSKVMFKFTWLVRYKNIFIIQGMPVLIPTFLTLFSLLFITNLYIHCHWLILASKLSWKRFGYQGQKDRPNVGSDFIIDNIDLLNQFGFFSFPISQCNTHICWICSNKNLTSWTMNSPARHFVKKCTEIDFWWTLNHGGIRCIFGGICSEEMIKIYLKQLHTNGLWFTKCKQYYNPVTS